MKNNYYIPLIKILIAFSLFCTSTLSIGQDVPKATAVVIEQGSDTAKIGSTITLQVENLGALTNSDEILIPYLDGLPLGGVQVSYPAVDTVSFVLRRTTTSKNSWDDIILRRSDPLSTTASLSLGPIGGSPIETDVNIKIDLANRTSATVFVLVLLISLGLFLYCTVRSNIIRDAGKEPETKCVRKQFSVSKVQMSVWFFLVIGAYPFIYLITGELGSISVSLLGLMGISAGTALGAAVIDSSKKNSNIILRHQLDSEKMILSQRVAEIQQQVNYVNDEILMPELTGKKTRLAVMEKTLSELPNFNKPKATQGFFKDIVSDSNGVSLHRFQIITWTVVLAIIFIIEVIANLRMPEFSPTLLGLMGVSSGTYLGFKIPEQPKIESF